MKLRKLIVILLFVCGACNSDRTAEINKNMRHYDDLIRHLDTEGISKMYLADGVLRGEGRAGVVGPDSIRKFLSAFNNIKIFDYHSTTGSTLFRGDTVIQDGTYYQKIMTPESDTLELGGKYKTIWIEVDHRWLIGEMYTYDYKNLRGK